MEMPPRGVNLPQTSMYFGSMSAMRSFMMMFMQSSWKSPWLRKLNRYSLSDLLSTMRTSGT